MSKHPGWRTDSPIHATSDPLGSPTPMRGEVARGHPSRSYISSPTTTHRSGSAIDQPRRSTGPLSPRAEKRKATSGIVNRLAENRKKRGHKQ